MSLPLCSSAALRVFVTPSLARIRVSLRVCPQQSQTTAVVNAIGRPHHRSKTVLPNSSIDSPQPLVSSSFKILQESRNLPKRRFSTLDTSPASFLAMTICTRGTIWASIQQKPWVPSGSYHVENSPGGSVNSAPTHVQVPPRRRADSSSELKKLAVCICAATVQHSTARCDACIGSCRMYVWAINPPSGLNADNAYPLPNNAIAISILTISKVSAWGRICIPRRNLKQGHATHANHRLIFCKINVKYGSEVACALVRSSPSSPPQSSPQETKFSSFLCKLPGRMHRIAIPYSATPMSQLHQICLQHHDIRLLHTFHI